MERMKLEAERIRVDAKERTKQREFELKMRELKASVNAQRDQSNTEIGSCHGRLVVTYLLALASASRDDVSTCGSPRGQSMS